jgi:hypothetical protein
MIMNWTLEKWVPMKHSRFYKLHIGNSGVNKTAGYTGNRVRELQIIAIILRLYLPEDSTNIL